VEIDKESSKGLGVFTKIQRRYWASWVKSHVKNKGSSKTEFIWSLGYALFCDITPFPEKILPNYSTFPPLRAVDPRNYCFNIKPGDIIWLSSMYVEVFVNKVLPKITVPFSLIITDGDFSFPSGHMNKIDVAKFIEDSRVIAIFAQNLDATYPSTKLFNLPIGLDFHSINRKGGYWGMPQMTAQEQEYQLCRIRETALPTEERIPRAFIDFHLTDRITYDGTRRSEILKKINKPGVCDLATDKMLRLDLWKKKAEYAFSISPHGVGLDCHRTWEDLLLGCIVIVKESPLDPLYKGLPIILVKDWNEITSKSMLEWKNRFGNVLLNPSVREKLSHTYWINQVRSITQRQLSFSTFSRMEQS
jgi:hypothetical protein